MSVGPPYDAGAIILAGGNSRRMGTNKCLLPYQGQPLIQHVVHQLRPLFATLTVSTNTPETYAFLELPMVSDRVTGQGPLAGIGAALARATSPWNFVVAADMPEISRDLIEKLAEHLPGNRCVVPVTESGHYEPLFAFYHQSLLPHIEEALHGGKFRMQDFLRHMESATVPVCTGRLPNLNTPSDYALSTKKNSQKPT